MTETLTQWMYLVSTHLLSVVLLILTLMSCVVLIFLGGFLREVFERRMTRRGLTEALDLAKSAPEATSEVQGILKAMRTGLPARFVAAQLKHGSQDVDMIFDDLNNKVSARLAVLSLLTRLGPMGGLIATLLPLGPALHALASGDMGNLASNLTIAFTATVIGLCVSCLAYAMGLARRTWYTRDLDDLECLTTLMLKPAE